MPFQCTIDHQARLVIVTARGKASTEEMRAVLNEVATGGAMPYRKLLDITQADLVLDPEILGALGAGIQKYAALGLGKLGPTAIVVASDDGSRRATIFAQAAKADRPFRIFHEMHEARRWLDSFAV